MSIATSKQALVNAQAPGAPSAPTFAFAGASGTPSGGQFTTNNAAVASTTTINIDSSLMDMTPYFSGNGGATFNGLQVTSAAGTAIFSANSYTAGAGYFSLSVTYGSGTFTNWSGNVSFIASARVLQVVLSEVLLNSAITPVADGTVTPVTSIATSGGIPTVIS